MLERQMYREARTMNNTDQDTVLRAIGDARRILGEYIAPDPQDATRTVHRLIAVLDRDEVVHALDRMNRRRIIGFRRTGLIYLIAPPSPLYRLPPVPDFFAGVSPLQPKESCNDRQRMTTMIEENIARLRTHRNSIARYLRLLQTKLTDLERQFIERRLSEEHRITSA